MRISRFIYGNETKVFQNCCYPPVSMEQNTIIKWYYTSNLDFESEHSTFLNAAFSLRKKNIMEIMQNTGVLKNKNIIKISFDAGEKVLLYKEVYCFKKKILLLSYSVVKNPFVENNSSPNVTRSRINEKEKNSERNILCAHPSSQIREKGGVRRDALQNGNAWKKH